jgi:hypothetical protein
LPSHPALRDRLLVTYYEPFVTHTERELRRVTDFLGVDFHASMLDVERFQKADGSPWPSDRAIYRASPEMWRHEMPSEMAELTEFVCDPEMRLHGYEPELYHEREGLSGGAFEFARRNVRDCLGWRTDFAEIERTLGSELYRKRMLASPETPSPDEIERCWLFPDVFARARQMQSAQIG